MSSSSYTESWLEGPQTTQFYTRLYPTPYPKGVIVFIHGFCDHIDRYTNICSKLAQQKFSVFAYDQRGFGKTALDITKKSKGSKYGKTCWADQMADMVWAIGHAKSEVPNVPVFIMGQSMGGGEVLGFATSPEIETVSTLAGVIATSPLILQTTPANKILRWTGGKFSLLAPDMSFPAEVPAVDLTHDETINENAKKDPLIKPYGSLRGISDMLSKGEELKEKLHKNWPESLPVIFIHGDKDRVTSHKATQAFHDAIPASSKKIVIVPGGFHELQNEIEQYYTLYLEEIISFLESVSAPRLQSNL